MSGDTPDPEHTSVRPEVSKGSLDRGTEWATLPPEAYAQGWSSTHAQRHEGPAAEPCTEAVVEEAPVTLVFNAQHAQVLMATPLDVEALALGFCLSEGLIERADELVEPLQALPAGAGLSVLVTLPPARLAALHRRLRQGAAVGACGLCGLPDQQAALALPPPRTFTTEAPTAEAIARALQALPDAQPLNQRTGAAHAAALAAPDGRLRAVMEDVSRHCALDKLIGHAARAGLPLREGFVLMSSRASFELVQKAARVGVPALVTVSAPTGLALRAAQRAGLHVMGFAREGRVTSYSGESYSDRALRS
ncbi:MAG: formate dehydrogenase accessory sulfurtransferase FdhD [Inhella sp.]|uniref:formate dehydrogenase accessory sulfurtransferase FdhD n=1 Tax=Inhella sp. TaxID=1921806 RepID=UPI00391F7796